MSSRLLQPILLLLLALGLVAWTVNESKLPPADFAFSNETEIESLDPAVVTGQPEGRIMWAIYEGLTRRSPVDSTPQPGVAESWDLSDDGLTYTFHLRKDAKWSNGDPFTSQDFLYSWRRMLDPMMAAEYGYQAWYIKGAKRYSLGARSLKPGDPVEIELHPPPPEETPLGAPHHARGEVLRGELKAVEEDQVEQEKLDDDAKFLEYRTFLVDIDGQQRRFRITPDPVEEQSDEARSSDASSDAPTDEAQAEAVKQILIDFSTVGVSAPDDHTLITTLEAPTAYWLSLTGFYPLFPVHQKTVETYGKPEWMYPENIVTNGAYKVVLRRLRDRLRLQKNEYYWDAENVAIDTIDAVAAESQNTAFNLYETGQVDWITKAPPLMSKELIRQVPPRDDLNMQPMFTSYYYLLNCKRKPTSDLRVRQALTLAIDRDEIVKTACAGEVAARSLVPPGVPGYVVQKCEPRNVERARELLAEAGYPDGVGFPKIEILYNNNEVHQLIAELVRKQWQRALGINVVIRNEEWSTYNSSLRAKDFDVARRAWGGDYLDPNTFLDQFVTGGENNDPEYSNPEYDKLIEAAKYELDPAKRMQLLQDAEAMMMRDLPLIPIYYYVSRNLVRPHIRGLYNNTLDDHPLWALSIDRETNKPNEYMHPPARSTPTTQTPGD